MNLGDTQKGISWVRLPHKHEKWEGDPVMRFKYMFVIVLLILIVAFSSALFFHQVDKSAARALLATFALLSVPLLAICMALEKMNFRMNEMEKKIGASNEE